MSTPGPAPTPAQANRAGSPSHKQQSSRRAQKLSEERLARKRELDRQAQRSARVKTKNYIAHLESRIDTLTKVQGTGEVKGLVDQIEDQRTENESLKAMLKTIGKLVGNLDENATIVETKTEVEDAKSPRQTCCHSHETEDNYDNTEQRNEQMHMSGPSNSTDLMLLNDGPAMGLEQSDLLPNGYSQTMFPDCQTASGLFESHMDYSKAGDLTIKLSTAGSLLHMASLLAKGESTWEANASHCCCKSNRLSNELLSQCSKLQLRNTGNQTIRDDDITIRAILHGWNAVTERYALDPVWQTLRHADNHMFSKRLSSLTERLITLRMVALKLRHQVNPTEQNLEALPDFLHERPSQRCIQHMAVTDYVPWPLLRERLVFNPHCYCNEKFLNTFWLSFRFTWEYDFRDAYVYNRHIGMYQFSAPFLERSRDLQCFRMKPQFFTAFPELKADVQETLPQPDSSSNEFEGDGFCFNMGLSQGLESLPNPCIEEGFPNMNWPLDRSNMRFGEV